MQIDNQDSLRNILQAINAFEYKRTIKPALSQVHAYFATKGPEDSIVSSLRLISDFGVKLTIRRIIVAIGPENFKSVTTNDAISTIDQVYESNDSTPLYTPKVKSEVIPVVEEPKPIDEKTNEEVEVEALGSDMIRLENIERRFSKFEAANFPEAHSKTSKATLIRIKTFIKNARSYAIPNGIDITDMLDDMEKWCEELDDILAGKIVAPIESSVPKPNVKILKRRKTKIVSPGQTTLDPEDDEDLEEAGKTLSEVDDDKVFAVTGLFKDSDGFLVIDESGNPSLNNEKFEAAYNEAKAALLSVQKEYETDRNSDKNLNASKFRRKLNIIFHAIKVQDWNIRSIFFDSKDDFIQKMGGAQNFDAFDRELNKQYLSTKLSRDMSLFDTIWRGVLALAINRSMYGHIQRTKPIIVEFKKAKIDVDPTDLDELTEKYLETAYERVRAKYFSTFRISSPAFYSTRKDTISTLAVKPSLFISMIWNSDYGYASAKENKARYTKTYCPVCFKQIKWRATGELKTQEEHEHFDAPAVIPYNIDKRAPITEADLRAAGKFAPPLGSKYRGPKTWDEIVALLASESITSHREGWIRRAEALKSLGGEDVGTTDITNTMFRCPYPREGSCGISLNKIITGDNFSPPIPTMESTPEEKLEYAQSLVKMPIAQLDQNTLKNAFDLLDTIEVTVDTKAAIHMAKRSIRVLMPEVQTLKETKDQYQPTYSPASIDGSLVSFDNKVKDVPADMRALMKTQAAGGYKFSKSFFRCPCRISAEMARKGLAGNKVENAYFTYAIPYSGVYNASEKSAWQLPTTPEGGESQDIPDGAFGYLICGAQTSLSAFDRNTRNVDGFAAMMSKIHNEDIKLFLSLLEYFIKEGVDVRDIMAVLPHISVQTPTVVSNKQIRDRIQKLADLLSLGMAKKGDDLFDQLAEFILICPFGHKFKIGDSLKFGENHLSMSLKGIKMVPYRDMINGKVDSLSFLIGRGDLIKLDKNIPRRYLYYSEWIAVPEKDRIVNIFMIQKALSQLSEEEYQDRIRNLAFLKFKHNDVDYVFRDNIRLAKEVWSGFGSATEMYAGEDRVSLISGSRLIHETANEEGKYTNFGETASAQEFQTDKYNIDNDLVVTEIPGSVFTGNVRKDLDAKRIALSRTLSSVLRIIYTWNSGIPNENMAEIFTIREKENVPLAPIALDVLTNIPKELTELQPISNLLMSEASALEEAIRDNVESFGIIRPQEEPLNFAVNILVRATMEVLTSGKFSGTIHEGNLAKIQKIVRKIAQNLLAGNESAIGFLTSSARSARSRVRDSSKERMLQKLFLLSFASYLATEVTNLATDYFNTDSPMYIGYDIGADLTDFDIVSNISVDILDKVLSAGTAALGLEVYKKFEGIEPEYNIDRLDRAYNRLILVLDLASKFSMNPYNVDKAKKYLTRRIAELSGNEASWVAAEIEKYFPLANMVLTHDIFSTDEGMARLSRNVPVTGFSRQITDMPDTRYPGGIIVNPSINFDSSKLQIGMISDRPQTTTLWPPEQQGFGSSAFVGFRLPVVSRGMAQNITASAMDLKILDFSMMISIDETPIDISFLFQRGFSDKDREALDRIESLILKAESDHSRAVSILGQELSGEEYDIQLAELQFAYRTRLESLRARRKEIPLNYVTGSNTFSVQSASRKDINDIAFIPKNEFLEKYARLVQGTKGVYHGYPTHRFIRVGFVIKSALRQYEIYEKASEGSFDSQASMETIRKLILELDNYKLEVVSTQPCLAITDPMNAFRLINSPALTGRILTEDEKEALINFIMHVYGAWRARDIAEELMDREVDPEELLTLRKPDGTPWDETEIKKFNLALKTEDARDSAGWMNHTGLYYDLYDPGSKEDAARASYIQYIYAIHTEKGSQTIQPPVNGIPTRVHLRDVKFQAIPYGLDITKKEKGAKKDSEDRLDKQAIKMSNRARAAMLRFVKNSTHSSPEVVGPKSENTEGSQIIDKISKRRNIVASIIRTGTIPELMPDRLIGEVMLEMMYEDMADVK